MRATFKYIADETLAAWNKIKLRGHARKWEDFPSALRKLLPELGWV